MKHLKTTSLVSRFGAVAALAMLVAFAAPSANATLLTYFNFNDAGTNGSQAAAAAFSSDNLSAVPPGLLSTTITTNYNATDVLSAQGSSINVAPGDPITAASNTGNHALSFTQDATNAGKSFQFTLSTLGFQNLVLTYANRSTSTGFASETLAYSTDGTTFTTVSTATLTLDSAYHLVTFDMTSLAGAVDNQSSLTLRLTFNSGGATTNAGTTNIDNIQLNASAIPVPEPATVVGGLLGGAGLLFHQRRRVIGMLKFA